MPRTLTSALAILLIAALAVPLWIFVIANRPEPLPAPPRRAGPSLVGTRLLERENRPIVVEAYGTLLPARRAVLAAELSGRVVWVRPDWRPGLRVREGQELVRLDAERSELELLRARAARDEAIAGQAAADRDRAWSLEVLKRAEDGLLIAKRELSRLESLEARDRVGASLVDQARTSLVAAEVALENARGRVSAAEVNEGAAHAREAQAAAAVALAEDSLERTTVRAPFDGDLAGRAPVVGSFLAAGAPVAECLDLSFLHLVANVHADELAAMSEGLPARVRLPSRPELAIEGRVRSVGPSVDPATRSGSVEIEIENAPLEKGEQVQRGLATGLFAHASIHAEDREDVLWIDRRHLSWQDEGAAAWVLVENREARLRPLVLGDGLGEGFAVRSGLEVGEELITGPLDRLYDGAPCERLATGEGDTGE